MGSIPTTATAHGKRARAAQLGDEARVAKAETELEAAKLRDHLVAVAPKLTDEQRAELQPLLAGA